ncbi:MAG: hypothetical protein ACETVU_00815 [Desulfatiglandales bacterium]
MTTRGDVVLIYYREEPSFFARIDSIEPDIKKDWFRVGLLILTIPLRTVTWILREEYIGGVPFTMEGNSIRIEAVNPLIPESDSSNAKKGATKKVESKDGTKIIPFVKSRKQDVKGT